MQSLFKTFIFFTILTLFFSNCSKAINFPEFSESLDGDEETIQRFGDEIYPLVGQTIRLSDDFRASRLNLHAGQMQKNKSTLGPLLFGLETFLNTLTDLKSGYDIPCIANICRFIIKDFSKTTIDENSIRRLKNGLKPIIATYPMGNRGQKFFAHYVDLYSVKLIDFIKERRASLSSASTPSLSRTASSSASDLGLSLDRVPSTQQSQERSPQRSASRLTPLLKTLSSTSTERLSQKRSPSSSTTRTLLEFGFRVSKKSTPGTKEEKKPVDLTFDSDADKD